MRASLVPFLCGSSRSLSMDRGLRKPMLARMRTRLVVFTLLLSLSEVNVFPPTSLTSLRGFRANDGLRMLWLLSYQSCAVVASSLYLGSREHRLKCSDWYRNVLQRSEEERYRGYVRMIRDFFQNVLGLLHVHALDVLFARRGAAQVPLEIQLAIYLFRFGHYSSAASVLLSQTYSGCLRARC